MTQRHVAYVISMPHGVDRWTYREIEALQSDELAITLFPVRYGRGPYMPPDQWDCYVFNRARVLAHQSRFMLRPRYTALLKEALQTGTLIDLLLAFDFSHEMRRRRIEHIHCVFGDHKLFIGYYCKKWLGLPLSVALYGYDLKANPNWTMFKRAIRLCDTIVVNCEYNKTLLLDIAGNELADRVQVIRHYANVPDQVSAPTILIVGGFEKRKGHDVLFQAVRLLAAQNILVRVWVAGYPGKVDVAQLVKTIGVEDQVTILGPVSDPVIELLFEQCDVFCLPSRTDENGISEGLPVAIIEAMAHGKPVISTRLAGIPEIVPDILVNEGDVPGLTEALKRYVTDPAARAEAGMRNRTIAQNQYSIRNVETMRSLLMT